MSVRTITICTYEYEFTNITEEDNEGMLIKKDGKEIGFSYDLFEDDDEDEDLISIASQYDDELTEDGHIKKECPICEGLEHVDFLEEHNKCDTCIQES